MKRTPAVERIIAAAVSHFAVRGYDGSSLTEIAEAVGIRKASLYTHFASKDALFMEIFRDALSLEQDIASQCFATEAKTAQPGSKYCASLIKRYGVSDHLRFLLRTGYMPPSALETEIHEAHERYLGQLQDAFRSRLIAYAGLSEGDVETYAHAYIGMVDSLQVKLVYTDARQATVRLKAMQWMLSDALAQATQRKVNP